MTETASKQKTFQWIKGDYEGKISTVVDTFIEDNIEFLVFEDGSQCNSALIGEYIINIPEGESPRIPVVTNQELHQKRQAEPVLKEYKEAAVDKLTHPVHDLLKISKKKKTKLEISIDIDMPSDELIRIINDSYENGDDIIGEYLVSAINQQIIMSQIENLVKLNIKQISTPKKTIKNESNS